MVMSWIWTGIVLTSILCALVLGNGSALAAATVSGAQAGIQLALSMAGSLCLWTGAGRLMEHAGITRMLSRLLRPLLHRVFPSTKEDAALAESLSANICANFLGLGNAATPMGIQGGAADEAGRHRHGRALPSDRAEHRLHPADPGECGGCPQRLGMRDSL